MRIFSGDDFFVTAFGVLSIVNAGSAIAAAGSAIFAADRCHGSGAAAIAHDAAETSTG